MLVFVQLVLLLLLFAVPGSDTFRSSTPVRVVGLAFQLIGVVLIGVSALGLGRRLTAHPEPNGRGSLQRSGVYGLMRHPMYSGVMALAVGSTLTRASWLRIAACLALCLLFNGKSRFEERELASHFPEYLQYAAKTPRFIPLGRLLRRHQQQQEKQAYPRR